MKSHAPSELYSPNLAEFHFCEVHSIPVRSELVLSLAYHIMPFRNSAIVTNIIFRSPSSEEQRRSFCASVHPPKGGYLSLLTMASGCLEVWASLFTQRRRTGVLERSQGVGYQEDGSRISGCLNRRKIT
jgi:hypothetical protein